VAEHSEFVSPNSAMNFLSDNGGDRYNLCHCAFSSLPPSLLSLSYSHHTVWSNFEIADLDFWRGPAYTAFFDFLESRGGFYYEVSLPPFSSRAL
jgi:alpha 1,2-mannosyltransferase